MIGELLILFLLAVVMWVSVGEISFSRLQKQLLSKQVQQKKLSQLWQQNCSENRLGVYFGRVNCQEIYREQIEHLPKSLPKNSSMKRKQQRLSSS